MFTKSTLMEYRDGLEELSRKLEDNARTFDAERSEYYKESKPSKALDYYGDLIVQLRRAAWSLNDAIDSIQNVELYLM